MKLTSQQRKYSRDCVVRAAVAFYTDRLAADFVHDPPAMVKMAPEKFRSLCRAIGNYLVLCRHEGKSPQ